VNALTFTPAKRVSRSTMFCDTSLFAHYTVVTRVVADIALSLKTIGLRLAVILTTAMVISKVSHLPCIYLDFAPALICKKGHKYQKRN
jgi:hypothetical protein